MKGIPVLTASGNGIAEAWENSLIELHRSGRPMKTQYDKAEDPPSKDATMTRPLRQIDLPPRPFRAVTLIERRDAGFHGSAVIPNNSAAFSRDTRSDMFDDSTEMRFASAPPEHAGSRSCQFGRGIRRGRPGRGFKHLRLIKL